MKLKIDHNLSPYLTESLSGLGHDIDTAAGEGLAAAADEELARVAAASGRMLLTEDKAFVDARRYPPGSHPGMILFRARSGPVAMKRLVEDFVRQNLLDELVQCIVVVEPGYCRVFRPPDQE